MESTELQHLEGKISGRIKENGEKDQECTNGKQGGWGTFPFIMGTVLGISLASGGWASNLIVYLITEFNVESITATQIFNIILGCNSLFPIAGAIIADSFMGSFSVVTICSCVSILGITMLTLTSSIRALNPPPCINGSFSCKTPSKLQFTVLYTSLALLSIGLGGTRFTVATMGADQFEKPNDQETFFNWYFFALCAANAISFTAIVYIQDNVSWGLGFGICIAANVIGFAAFLLGKRFYRHVKPKGSPFMSITRVIVAAMRKRKMSGSWDSQDYYYGSNEISNKHFSGPTASFRFLNRAAVKAEGELRPDGSNAKLWRLCTVEEVEDLKILLKIMPLWSSSIFLCTPIGIFSSLAILEALTMDRHIGQHFKIPAGTFLVFNIIAIAISISLIDRFLMGKWKNLTGRILTPLQRIGIGHVLNILGMIGAALVENRRLHAVWTHQLTDKPNSIVPISALWLVVPLAVVGIGEAFHLPGQVSLYYQEFPTSLRSTSTAMISLLLGIGFYLSTAITGLVQRTTGWLPDNINKGRVDNMYWMLIVIGVVNLGYYLVCAQLFKYHNTEKREEENIQSPEQ